MDWIGWVIALVLLGFITVRGVMRRRKTGTKTHIAATIDSMRSVGELVAFKIVAKEIVTSSDHWMKDFGKKYLRWLVSEKKMALIFEFEIDFRYDLRSSDFKVEELNEDSIRITMPPCFYEISLKSQKYYDEQESQLLPDILPPILSAWGKFTEEDRNQLLEEARNAAECLAMQYVQSLRHEVEKSARQTILTMAHNLGAESVEIDFMREDFTNLSVSAADDAVPAAVKLPS